VCTVLFIQELMSLYAPHITDCSCASEESEEFGLFCCERLGRSLSCQHLVGHRVVEGVSSCCADLHSELVFLVVAAGGAVHSAT
jgi:hypothetical protein